MEPLANVMVVVLGVKRVLLMVQSWLPVTGLVKLAIVAGGVTSKLLVIIWPALCTRTLPVTASAGIWSIGIRSWVGVTFDVSSTTGVVKVVLVFWNSTVAGAVKPLPMMTSDRLPPGTST